MSTSHAPQGDATRDHCLAVMAALDTPLSLGIWLRYKYDESQLTSITINPLDYTTPLAFALDYQAVSYLKKYKGLRTSVDKAEVALAGFFEGERRLFTVNRFLQSDTWATKPIAPLISEMQRLISNLLGPFSLFKLEDCAWGPGATATLRGSRSTVVHKLREEQMSVTSDCLDFARAELGRDIHWMNSRGIPADAPCTLLDSEFLAIDHGRLLTVPKDSSKDRVIAAEPTINIFFQKAVGSFFRSRLLTVGINLDDQSINQMMAERAFKDRLATIDLKNASNSVSNSLVELLLPPDWYGHLCMLRTKFAKHKGRRYRLELFSSMGNGFTFELESLIFWAACASVVGVGHRDIGVYGDDLIVPQRHAPRLVQLLSYIGFETNVTKSFVDGCFFESCGKHYFQGTDVTPLFRKEILKISLEDPTVRAEWYRCANAWWRLAKSSPLDVLQRKAMRIARSVRSALLLYGEWQPEFFGGDVGLICPYEHLSFHALRSDRNRGVKLRSLRIRGRKRIFWYDHMALLSLSLRFGPPELPYSEGLGVRGQPAIERSSRWFSWDCVK